MKAGQGEYQYIDLLMELVTSGVYREGRNGGTYGLFGRQIRFNLQDGFPLLTTKKVFFKGIKVEALWFLKGDTNTKYLEEHGVSIWREWQDENGDLGPIYGKQWRAWPTGRKGNFVVTRRAPNGEASAGYQPDITIDQIQNLIDGLKADPHGRRHIVTAWNPADIPDMALPPCHCLFQFFVANGKLSCQLYQRSADFFLGVPFNIASYALLTHLIAREVGLEVGEFVHTFGDVHLYANHVEQAKLQLTRDALEFPKIRIESDKSIFELEPQDIVLVDYHSHAAIEAEVSK